MNHDPLDELKHAAPPPSAEAMQKAWLSACCEFHRNRHSSSQASHRHKWLWPLAAVAAVGILCAILFTTPISSPQLHSEVSHTTEIENVFQQGQQLFGNRLKAVSISGDNITWHLRETTVQQTTTPQFVTLTIKNKDHLNVHLAAYIDTPINLEFEGQQHELEFLPDASGQLIAYGNDIYWDSETPSSPIAHAKFQTVSP